MHHRLSVFIWSIDTLLIILSISTLFLGGGYYLSKGYIYGHQIGYMMLGTVAIISSYLIRHPKPYPKNDTPEPELLDISSNHDEVVRYHHDDQPEVDDDESYPNTPQEIAFCALILVKSKLGTLSITEGLSFGLNAIENILDFSLNRWIECSVVPTKQEVRLMLYSINSLLVLSRFHDSENGLPEAEKVIEEALGRLDSLRDYEFSAAK